MGEVGHRATCFASVVPIERKREDSLSLMGQMTRHVLMTATIVDGSKLCAVDREDRERSSGGTQQMTKRRKRRQW